MIYFCLIFFSDTTVDIDNFGRYLCDIIWRYFKRDLPFFCKMDFKENNEKVDKTTSKCKLCNKNIKRNGNTTNLKTHLKNKPNDAYLKCTAVVSKYIIQSRDPDSRIP